MGNLCTVCEAPHSNMVTRIQQPATVIEDRLHNCVIRISSGDLLQENTDAIAAVLNPSLSFQGKLCKQLLEQGGKTFASEIQRIKGSKTSYECGQVFYTHSGELEYDYIFFAILPSNPFHERKKTNSYVLNAVDSQYHKDQRQYVYQSITNILKQAEDLQLNSVSFPFISGDQSTTINATMMLVAIKSFLEDMHNKLQHLNLINITILEKELIGIMTSVFKRIIQGQHETAFENFITPNLKASQDFEVRRYSGDNQTHEHPETEYLLRFGHPCHDQNLVKLRESI